MRACEDRHWQECRRWLDDAERLDPAGEETPEVKEMRQTLGNALAPPVEMPREDKLKPRP